MADELTPERATARERRTFRLGYWLFFGAFPFAALAAYVVIAVLGSEGS